MTTTLPLPANPASQVKPVQPDLLCWRCASVLCPLTDTTPLVCAPCGAVTSCPSGIWQSLSPDRALAYDRFIAEYEFIRRAEGRASQDPAYYRALPFTGPADRLRAQWAIRASTFRYIQQYLLPRTPARILDLGAGNGWLSHRLALLGHQPVAVDLLTNSTDGLGAAVHYAPVRFPRVQASLDQLPFADATFDLAIFNASFHYSENYRETLAEALRVVRREGSVLLADTPWYADEAQGELMVKEKHAAFQSAYGFASDSIHHQEFLTPRRLDHLADTLHLKWQVYKPFYGLKWALRPLRARLAHRRTPSHFRIFVASRQP
jgi:SAM-dependent methyltransferase